MNVISIKLTKDYIYSVTLSDASGAIQLVDQNRAAIQKNVDIASLMEFYKTSGDNLLSGLSIDKAIFSKPTVQATVNDTLVQNLMATGVWVLCCKNKSILCELRSTQNLGWKKLGYSNKTLPKDIVSDMATKFPDLQYKNPDTRTALALGLLGF
jgi:hypothetical protein